MVASSSKRRASSSKKGGREKAQPYDIVEKEAEDVEAYFPVAKGEPSDLYEAGPSKASHLNHQLAAEAEPVDEIASWIAVVTSGTDYYLIVDALTSLGNLNYVHDKTLSKGIRAARLGLFEAILKVLQDNQSKVVTVRAWITAASIMFMNPAAQRHMAQLMDGYLSLVGRDWQDSKDSIVFFLNQAAEVTSASPSLYRYVMQQPELLKEVAVLSGGEFVEKVGATARVQKDTRMLAALRRALDDIANLEVLVRAPEPERGSWDLAILEVYGAVEDHPIVKALLADGILDGFLRVMCNLALSNGEYEVRNHFYDMINLEVLVNMSTVETIAWDMVLAGYLDICFRAIDTPADSDHLESILRGQAACVETMCNIARFHPLRGEVKRVLKQSSRDGTGHETLHLLRNGKDARIRAGAQKLLFDIGWLSASDDGNSTPAEVVARGPEAEAAYKKAMEGGQGRIKSVKIVLLGEDRSGKSSVLASVSGAGWDPRMESTHGVVTSHFKIPVDGNWKPEQGGLTAAEAAATAVAANLRGAAAEEFEAAPEVVQAVDHVEEPTKASTDKQPTVEGGSSEKQPSPDKPAHAEGKSKSSDHDVVAEGKSGGSYSGDNDFVPGGLGASDIPLDLIAMALQEDERCTRVVVKDTAGQPRYHGMLARALSASCVPAVVFSVERWAKNVVKHHAFSSLELDMELNVAGRKAGTQEEESTLGSELRLFHYWFSMIQVRTKSTPAVIVGTHMDKVSTVLEHDQHAISELLAAIHCRIEDLLLSVSALDRVLPCSDLDLLFFPVDNSATLSGGANGIARLQAAIRESVHDVQTSGSLSKKVPLSWVQMLDAIKAMQRPCLSITDVCRVVEHFGLKSSLTRSKGELETEVRAALTLLHDIGEVSFFPEAAGSCSKMVFADPELLSLAEANVLDCPRTVKQMNKLATLLHKSAVLDEALLPALWENLLKLEAKAQPRTEHDPIDFKKVLLDFLIADGFLVPIYGADECRFLVPSLLQRWTPQGQEQAPATLTDLALTPPCEATVAMDILQLSLPELFPHVLSKLLQHPQLPAFNGRTDTLVLFRNAVQMLIPSGTLIMFESPLERPTEVLVHIAHFVPTTEISCVSHLLQVMASILEETGRRIAANFKEQVVVGPIVKLADGKRVIVSLQEVLRSVEVHNAVRTTQLPSALAVDRLPKWVHELLPSSAHGTVPASGSLDPVKPLTSREQVDLSEDRSSDGPEHNAITVAQLSALAKQSAKDYSDAAGMTMYDVNERIVRPACAQHGKPYARVLNDPEPKTVQVFVSHAWKENFAEFADSVEVCFRHEPEKPNIWVCAFALYQSADRAAVSAQLGRDPSKAPFTDALKCADRYLVVRNQAVDIFTRIWCCWELYCADKYGFLDQGKGKFLITGPSCFPETALDDVAKAEASDAEDKRLILNAITSGEIYHVINKRIRQIKGFAVDDRSSADPHQQEQGAHPNDVPVVKPKDLIRVSKQSTVCSLL